MKIKMAVALILAFFMAWPAFGAVVSSRTMPDNPDIKTFGGAGAGRDYTSIATWEAATRGDITGAEAKSPVLECYADEAVYDISTPIRMAQTNIAHTSATKFRCIKAASGHENRFTKDSGVILRGAAYAGDYGIIWSEDEAYGAVYDIGFTYPALNDATNRSHIDTKSSASNWRFAGIYIFDSTNAGSGVFRGIFSRAANTTHINCVADNINGSGFVTSIASGKTFYNCTAVNVTRYGFFAANHNAIAVNCISEGNTIANWGESVAVWSKTKCTNGGGVVFAADGISLDSTDTLAKDQGNDLEAAIGFNDDGMGIERGDGTYTGASWDIGALEYTTYAPPASGSRRIPFLLF